MLRSLTIEENHQQFIECWFNILEIYVHQNSHFCSLLNLLLHGMFCEKGKYDPKQVQRLATRFNSNQIFQFSSNCKTI